MELTNTILTGDCLRELRKIPAQSVDLAYLDPPFFTQQTQRLKTRDRTTEFSFGDTWHSRESYMQFMVERLVEIRRTLKETGSIFFHCDRNASHIARFALDDVFGPDRFLSEIIWYYRRWSSAVKNLLPAHQTILFYSNTQNYKFNTILQDYSPSTNIDQILQRRKRDGDGKSIYETDDDGRFVPNGPKRGVPMSDVWDIPYLNPKAKERAGYPTQKPILLLERIILLASEPDDLVLDPFCGSGTTLVASKMTGRRYLGIDISPDAVNLAESRLKDSIKSDSNLLNAGRSSYQQADERLLQLLDGLDFVPVQRNRGIDAFLNYEYRGSLIPLRFQREDETVIQAAEKLHKAASKKQSEVMFLICHESWDGRSNDQLPPAVIPVSSTVNNIRTELQRLSVFCNSRSQVTSL
ncbi:MAG: site-specific DNA-methyltransferase [Cyanobacteria bacterium]|nr:site-specific DNA-methyltransferase [Cyanobacteriota bacterium]